MLVRCAWCKRIIGAKPPFGGRWDREITDGICENCAKKYFGSYGDKKEKEDESNADKQKEI